MVWVEPDYVGSFNFLYDILAWIKITFTASSVSVIMQANLVDVLVFTPGNLVVNVVDILVIISSNLVITPGLPSIVLKDLIFECAVLAVKDASVLCVRRRI